MMLEKHKPILLPLAAVFILLVASHVSADFFYPNCKTPSGAKENPKARGKCAFHCPLDMKHTVCGTDGKHYHNECFLCRHACLKVTLAKACDGPCPCNKNHNGRQAVHHNGIQSMHHNKHLKQGQARHPHYANGKKHKMRRKVYKLRKGKKHIRKKNGHANETMRNHHKKHADRKNYGHVKLKHGVKHKVRNMHQRMKGHEVIVKKGGMKGKYVYTNHRSVIKNKNKESNWMNGFGGAIRQWANKGNGRGNHNAFAKITNTRHTNGRPGKGKVYPIPKGGYTHHVSYKKKKIMKPHGKRYGFFKKRMLRSKRKRKRKHKPKQ